MITYCAWCPKDAPPMHDDGRGTLITHGICQPHLFEMRAKLQEYYDRADCLAEQRATRKGEE